MTAKVWMRHPDAGGVQIPKTMQRGIVERIKRHAEQHFGGRYSELAIRFRGAFCYVDAITDDLMSPDPRGTPVHLCRLRYFGNPDQWSFGFYKYSDEKYEVSVFPSGKFWGAPEDAFDLAASVYLGG